MQSFTFNHNGKIEHALVEPFKEGEYHRFLIIQADLRLVIAPAGIRDSAGRIIWVQTVKPREFVQPHDFIQAIGVGLEQGGFHA